MKNPRLYAILRLTPLPLCFNFLPKVVSKFLRGDSPLLHRSNQKLFDAGFRKSAASIVLYCRNHAPSYLAKPGIIEPTNVDMSINKIHDWCLTLCVF